MYSQKRNVSNWKKTEKWSKLRASGFASTPFCSPSLSWVFAVKIALGAMGQLMPKSLTSHCSYSQKFFIKFGYVLRHFLLLCIPGALHTTTVNLSLTQSVLSPCWSPSLLSLKTPSCLFLDRFKSKDYFSSSGIKAFQLLFFFSSESLPPPLSWISSHPQHLPLILISCLINNSVR